jgi:hypothetical protein
VSRRLDRAGAGCTPLDAAALARAFDAGLGGTDDRVVHEHRDHLRIGDMWHVTVHGECAPEVAVRLADAPADLVVVAQTGRRVAVRCASGDPTALVDALAHVREALGGGAPPRQGAQFGVLAETLPVPAPAPAPARVPVPARVPPVAVAARDAGTQWPAVAVRGLTIGHDRHGNAVQIRLDPDGADGGPVRVAIVGPRVARSLYARARVALTPAHAVPVTFALLDPPTATDADVLRGADVVVCQSLDASAAAVVAAALGLAEARTWLTRVDREMAAVVSDGIVRWVRA